jgi:hypothetical protein
MQILWGILFLFITVSAFAMPAEEREETRIPILDRAEEFFGNRVNGVANDFDSFFATERADDELGRSRLRLRRNYTMQERELGIDKYSFRFNMRLPKLEQTFKNLFKSKKKEKKKKETATEKAERLREEKINRNKVLEGWLFNGDVSGNASIHPSLTVRGRARKSYEMGVLIHRFVQEESWISTADGFRNRTQLDSDHTFTSNWLFRFTNLVDWRISKKNFITAHGPGIFQRLSDFDAITYAFTMGTTVQDGAWYVSNFRLAPTYRRNLYKEMLYFDFQSGLDWPKKWSFRRTPFVFFQLELLLGGN